MAALSARFHRFHSDSTVIVPQWGLWGCWYKVHATQGWVWACLQCEFAGEDMFITMQAAQTTPEQSMFQLQTGCLGYLSWVSHCECLLTTGAT
jgi:hypothetical protein